MKNFGTLFGFELKKIWKRPLTLAVVLLMTALSVYVAAGGLAPYWGHTLSTEDGSGVEFIPGDEWSARMEEGGRWTVK